MRPSSEFRNVIDINLPGTENIRIAPPPLRRGSFAMTAWTDPIPSERDRGFDTSIRAFVDTSIDNSTILERIVAWLSGRRQDGEPALPTGEVPAGTVYFPPGRYYLGRPGTIPSSETLADIVVPANVTLRFAPGATLVLMNYEAIPVASRPTTAFRPIPGRPEYDLLVRMEIQGRIDAGAYPIFDVLMQDLADNPSLQRAPLRFLQRAGHIDLTRNTTRGVYPEWFGAALPPGDFANGIPQGLVYRTSLAMQEAIDVAHTRRRRVTFASVPGGPPGAMGVSGRIVRSTGGSAPGVFFGGRMFPAAGGASEPIGVAADGVASSFVANSVWQPTIPVVLRGTYVIDRELTAGFSLADVEAYSTALARERPDPFHQPNLAPFVLRGQRGPRGSGAGSPTIRAWATSFEPFWSTLSRTTAASLLGVRGPTGSVIEGVTFDGALQAPRCLTLEAVGGAQVHDVGLTSCAFRRARRELLHIGGELGPSVMENGREVRLTGGNMHFSGNQDLAGMRVARCVFDTGTPEALAGLGGGGVALLPTGVLYRAGQALGMVFENCVFRGPASPMFHAVTLRMGIVGCSFTTSALPSTSGLARRRLDGVDIFLDTPPFEAGMPRSMSEVAPDPAVMTLKDIVSRSLQFIATFTEVTNPRPFSAVYLIGVDHEPTALGPAEPAPPAIYWAGPTRANGRLVLMGCRFGRPTRVAVPGDVLPPVGIDVLTGMAPTDYTAILGGINNANRHEGHVVDLGTRIDGAGPTIPVAVMLVDMGQLTRVAGPLWRIAAGQIRDLRIFERYERRAP